MVDEIEGNSEEEEEGEWNKIGPNGNRKATNQRKNKNNKNNSHNQNVERNEQQGPVSILQTGNNYQSRQQRGSIAFESGQGGKGGRGSMNQSTNQHTKGNTNRNSDPPPPPARKDRIHHFKLTFNPKVIAAKRLSVKTIIQDTCKSIQKKTGSKARFLPMSKIQLPPPSIENISTYFLTTRAELLDFFLCQWCIFCLSEVALISSQYFLFN